MFLPLSYRFAAQLTTVLTLVWIRTSHGQESNCQSFTLSNGVFSVCMNSNQNLAVGVRPIVRCELTPDNTDACVFDHWELDGSVITIAEPDYTPIPTSSEHGNSFRIEQPSTEVAGTYKCFYSCNSGSNLIATDLTLPFHPTVEFTTPDNIMYWSELGTTVTLKCSINYYSTFLWKYDNGTVLAVHTSSASNQALNGTSLTISNVTVSDNNTYRCSAKNSVTSNKFIRAYLFVYLLPKIVESPSKIITSEGNRTTMVCTVCAVPKPSIIWSKAEAVLTFDGRLQEETVYVNSYTVKSTVIITHTASSDQGTYQCTAFSTNGTTKHSTTSNIILEVQVPLEPLLETFNTSVNSTSITIGWIVSGVPESNMITVEWKFLNDTFVGMSPNLAQELTTFQITSLAPGMSYVITVRTQNLVHNITVTTLHVQPAVPVVSSTSLSSISPSYTPNPLPPTVFMMVSSSSVGISTVTPIAVSSNSDYIIFAMVVVGTVLVALIVMVTMIMVLIVVVRKKSDFKKTIESNGSLQKPYISESPQIYRHQLSGGSMNSIPTITTMVSQDNSLLQYPSQHSFTAMDFAAVQGLTGSAQLTALNGNGMVEKVGFISTTPPGHNPVLWTIGQPQHVVGVGEHNTFEMTENPANSHFEMEKSRTHLLPGNSVHEPSSFSDERPTSIPPYLGSESASQVYMHSSHPMPQGVASPYNHAYREQEEEFEYTDNAVYEMHTPSTQEQKANQEQHWPREQRLTSSSSLDEESRRFKIVSRERGAVFEKVEIKPRP